MDNNITTATENKILKPGPKEIVLKYLVYLPLFIIMVVTSVSIAWLYLRYKVPMYSSGVLLLIKDDSKGGGTSDAVLEGLGISKKRANLANETELLKTASLMVKVVDTLNLNLQYFSSGNVKRSEIFGSYPFVYRNVMLKDSAASFTLNLHFNKNGDFQVDGLSSKWFKGGETVAGPQGSFTINSINPRAINPKYTYYISWQPAYQVARGLAASLKITQLSREASILKISIDTEVPRKGVDILNQLVIAYNQNTVEDKNRIVDNTIRFVDERLSYLTGELGGVEKGLQVFRQKNEIIDIDAQGQSKIGEIKGAQEELSKQEISLRVIDMIRTYIANPAQKNSLVPSSLGIDDPTLNTLISEYNALQLKRSADLKTMPPDNPIIVLEESQLEKLRTNIAENLNNIRTSSQSLLNNLQARFNSLRGDVQKTPGQQRQLLEIMREQGIKEKLFLFLLQKREESSITRASAVSGASALDAAVASGSPISPDRTGTYRIAIFLGLLIPALYIYLKELLSDKIILKNDISKATAIPIIGEVAHHVERNRQFVVGTNDRSLLAEQFRIVRTNLQFFITNKQNPVLLITSSVSGEGKTFTSMNVGSVWALANKKTVILELDLRKPKISQSLGLLNNKGITDYMLGHAAAKELPIPVKDIDNLYIISAGPIPPNPSELLMEKKMDDLFEYLRKDFDFIVIDSAPVGLVSDAKILSRFADATLYVVRQRYTFKKQLLMVDELYTTHALPGMGILMNDVKRGAFSAYYGYGYGYGYGYNNDYASSYGNEKKIVWWKKMLNIYR